MKYKLKYKPKKAFTLFEIVLSLIIFSMLVGIIFTAYINIKKSENSIWDQQLITKEASSFLDRLHDLSLDYTIDYEEYFNRYHTKCGTEFTSDFAWNPSGNCIEFTDYWKNSSRNCLHYCSSSAPPFGQSSPLWYTYYPLSATGFGCPRPEREQCFWQYRLQFRDISDWDLNDWDDIFMWEWPIAIWQNTWVQELYLINKDWDHRIFFRRKLVLSWDLNWDWMFTWINEKLYTIQILKLKWFDAGINNDFNTWISNWWVYDGYIDTRVCDTDAWFVCTWALVTTIDFIDYYLPLDVDDGWVDITDLGITVSDRNFEIYPAKDPYLAQNESGYLMDPFIKVNLTTNLYWIQSSEEITLQTSIWFKNSYFNFDMVEFTGSTP